MPVAWPIGKLLDHILGHEEVTFDNATSLPLPTCSIFFRSVFFCPQGGLFRRAELKAFVQIHGKMDKHGAPCVSIPFLLERDARRVLKCQQHAKFTKRLLLHFALDPNRGRSLCR